MRPPAWVDQAEINGTSQENIVAKKSGKVSLTVQPEGADTDVVAGSNCTDETKREYWRKALIAKIGLESAQATAKKKNGEYRSVLKDAKKAGVDTDALTEVLALRFQDPDVLIVKERERLKMLDLSGVVPNVKDTILARLDVEEPTRNERAQMDVDRAYDSGAFDGRSGAPRDTNGFEPGSELYDAYDRGWCSGQAAIADEMHMGEPPRQVDEAGLAASLHEQVSASTH